MTWALTRVVVKVQDLSIGYGYGYVRMDRRACLLLTAASLFYELHGPAGIFPDLARCRECKKLN